VLIQALSMTMNGCPVDAPTWKEMSAALQYHNSDMSTINAAHAELLKQLDSNADSVLKVANSLWARDGVKAALKSVAEKYFRASAMPLTTPEPINQWCSNATNGKIPTIIQSVKPVDELILVNAVYFKGTWKWSFDPAQTRLNYPCTNLMGQPKSCSMMHLHRKDFRFAETERFQALELPYGGSGSVSAFILLPSAGTPIQEFVQSFQYAEFAATFLGQNRKLAEKEGNLFLPRFKVESEYDLQAALNALGMVSAFDDTLLPLTEVCEKPCYISKVAHKTFVECNEIGTEAAAVTAVVVSSRCAVLRPTPKFTMICDRPFIFAIAAKQTLLFLGVVDASE
jgi:serpin B